MFDEKNIIIIIKANKNIIKIIKRTSQAVIKARENT